MVELPSGNEIEIRKMRLSDEDIVLDRDLARKDESTDKLLQEITGLTRQELDDLLIGDRVFALLHFRRISRGDLFYPKAVCPYCLDRWEAEIDLSNLVIQKLDKEKIDEQNQFELILPVSEATLKMRLLTGKEQRELKKIRKNFPDKLMSYLMLLRTVEITNNEGEKVSKNVEWFRNLDNDDSDYIRDSYDEYDCGVETSIEVMCPACDAVFDYEIPFDAHFFLQTRRIGKVLEKKFQNF